MVITEKSSSHSKLMSKFFSFKNLGIMGLRFTLAKQSKSNVRPKTFVNSLLIKSFLQSHAFWKTKHFFFIAPRFLVYIFSIFFSKFFVMEEASSPKHFATYSAVFPPLKQKSFKISIWLSRSITSNLTFIIQKIIPHHSPRLQ